MTKDGVIALEISNPRVAYHFLYVISPSLL